MLDVTTGGAGDVRAALVDYTLVANRALIESSFTKTPFLQGIPTSARDAMAAHSGTTSTCGTPN